MSSHDTSGRLTEIEVLEALSAHRHPLTLRQIAEKLDLSHAGRRDLKKIIGHLSHAGAIEEPSSGHYRLARNRGEGAAPEEKLPRDEAAAARRSCFC